MTTWCVSLHGQRKNPDLQRQRAKDDVEESLRAAGLITSTILSRDEKEDYVRVTATEERLERHAEYMQLEMPTLLPTDEPSSGGDEDGDERFGESQPFISATTDQKRRALFPAKFSTYQRQQIIRDIIEERK